jgi:hypothetical protein
MIDMSTITNGFSGDAMAAPTNRDQDLVFAGDSDAGDDVGSTCTASDNGRTSINHGVGNCTSFVIARIAGAKGWSAN